MQCRSAYEEEPRSGSGKTRKPRELFSNAGRRLPVTSFLRDRSLGWQSGKPRDIYSMSFRSPRIPGNGDDRGTRRPHSHSSSDLLPVIDNQRQRRRSDKQNGECQSAGHDSVIADKPEVSLESSHNPVVAPEASSNKTKGANEVETSQCE